jgi:hypothetical protein
MASPSPAGNDTSRISYRVITGLVPEIPMGDAPGLA